MTASPVQLVVMLYDGANRFLRQAQILHEQGQPIQASTSVGRAQAIVEELLATLDIERGGQLAERLQGIYVYCLGKMSDSRMTQSTPELAEVMELLAELRESWNTIAQQQGAAA
jgi:flagellar protein FliS